MRLKTAVMFGPLLPGLSDTPESIGGLCRLAASLEIDTVWVDALNPRPRVWPAVAALLRAEFPELLPSYRRILFDAACRQAYLAELRARVEHAAQDAGIGDRVGTCMQKTVPIQQPRGSTHACQTIWG